MVGWTGGCVGLLEGVFEVVYIICRPPIILVHSHSNFRTRIEIILG